jgi:hypothetical protein
MGLIPALKTLLETPWMALAGVATRQDARMLLKNVHGLSTLGENIHRFTWLRRFRQHYWRGNQDIEVISCAPLMSSADSDVFKFWGADECEHSNYHTFVP